MKKLCMILGVLLLSGCASEKMIAICGTPAASSSPRVTVSVVVSDSHVDMQPVIKLPASMSVRYPFSMSRAGISGIVRAKLHIESDGRVSDCTVIRDTKSEFREAVLSSVATLRFFPARLAGQTLPSDVECEFLFDLDDE